MGSIDSVRSCASDNYPASEAIVRAYDAAKDETKSSSAQISVTAKYRDRAGTSHNTVTVSMAKAEAMIPLLLADPLVTSFSASFVK